MPTDDQLKAIMPALSDMKRQAFLPFLQQAIEEFAIASAARQAAFLAQLAHESGQLRFMEELWGPTDAQRRYEPVSTLATRLGNTEPGDGKRFKGRGPIQLTGRANYQTFGATLGVDLLEDPAKAATADLAFRVAGLFWQRNGLNELADQATAAAFKQITRRINGGFNGLEDRQRFYAVACQVLGVTLGVVVPPGPVPVPPAPVGMRGIGAVVSTGRLRRGAEAIRTHEAVERTRKRRARTARVSKAARKKAVRKATTRKRTVTKRARGRKR